jgi:hypothetical protein
MDLQKNVVPWLRGVELPIQVVKAAAAMTDDEWASVVQTLEQQAREDQAATTSLCPVPRFSRAVVGQSDRAAQEAQSRILDVAKSLRATQVQNAADHAQLILKTKLLEGRVSKLENVLRMTLSALGDPEGLAYYSPEQPSDVIDGQIV